MPAVPEGAGAAARGLAWRSYACSTDTNPPQPYAVFLANGTIQSCTVTIDNPGVLGGAHVAGTFSAVFTPISGQSDKLTEGKFDAPLR